VPLGGVALVESFIILESGRLIIPAIPSEQEIGLWDYLPFTYQIGYSIRNYIQSADAKLLGKILLINDEVEGVRLPVITDMTYESGVYVDKAPGPDIEALQNIFEIERVNTLYSITPSITNHTSYTGIMRLFQQSLLGVGRIIGRTTYFIVPFDFIDAGADANKKVCPFASVDPLNDGLIFSPDMVFWWVRIEPTKVVFSKMTLDAPEFVRSLLVGLYASWPSKLENTIRSMSIIMSFLQSDTTSDQIEILIPELSNVFGGREPLAWGWHFNHSYPWEASIVTISDGPDATKLSWYFTSTLAKLVFSFSDFDGLPSAELTIEAQDTEFYTPTQLRRPLLYMNCLFVPTIIGTTAKAGLTTKPVSLYCYYEIETNSRVLIKHRINTSTLQTRNYTSIPLPPSRNEWYVCGTGSFSFEQHFEAYYPYATGYVIEGSTNDRDFSAVLVTQDQVSYTTQTSVYSHTVSNLVASAAPDNTIGVTCNEKQTQDYNASMMDGYYFAAAETPIGGYTATKAFRNSTNLTRKTDWFNHYQFCLIPRSCAESVYIGTNDFGRDFYHNNNVSTAILPQTVQGDWNLVKWSRKVNVDSPLIVTDDSLTGVLTSGEWGTNFSTSVNTSLPLQERNEGKTYLYNSTGIFDCGSAHDGWNSCFSYQVDPCVYADCGGDVAITYNKGGHYLSKQVNRIITYTYLDGYTAEPSTFDSIIRYTGFS
jgi:hypothetical protein